MARKRNQGLREETGIGAYLKEAFLFRWNLLGLVGAVGAAMLSPFPDVLLPLVGAAELLYLTGVISIPRFRSAIDAKQHAERKLASQPDRASDSRPTLQELLASLPLAARQRFQVLRQRCLEMRTIAQGVTGRTRRANPTVEGLGDTALDRLLWVFLRLQLSDHSLGRFLHTTEEKTIRRQVEQARQQLTEAESAGDERKARSLRDSLATSELRHTNYQKAQSNAEFVSLELDRLERKIQTLSEMAINRQDPDFISREVDSVTASIHQTEAAMNELQLVTGLIDDLDRDPPVILASDFDEAYEHEG